MATTSAKTPAPKASVTPAAADPNLDELAYDGADEEAQPSVSQLLDAIEGDAPTAEEIDEGKRNAGSVPDGDYIAKLSDIKVVPGEQGPRVLAYPRVVSTITAEGTSNDNAGRFLPIVSVPLQAAPNEKGRRMDFHLWNLADAVLGEATRKEIQKSSPKYSQQIKALLDEMAPRVVEGTALFACHKAARKVEKGANAGKTYDNITRIYSIPPELIPSDVPEDA